MASSSGTSSSAGGSGAAAGNSSNDIVDNTTTTAATIRGISDLSARLRMSIRSGALLDNDEDDSYDSEYDNDDDDDDDDDNDNDGPGGTHISQGPREGVGVPRCIRRGIIHDDDDDDDDDVPISRMRLDHLYIMPDHQGHQSPPHDNLFSATGATAGPSTSSVSIGGGIRGISTAMLNNMPSTSSGASSSSMAARISQTTTGMAAKSPPGDSGDFPQVKDVKDDKKVVGDDPIDMLQKAMTRYKNSPDVIRQHYLNVINAYGDNAPVLVSLAKLFRSFKKDHPLVERSLRLAYKVDPMHAELNYLCAMYLCEHSETINLGPGSRQMFLYLAVLGDRYKFEYLNEYYHLILGTISVSSGPGRRNNYPPEEDDAYAAVRRERDPEGSHLKNITKSIFQILETPTAKMWPESQRVQMQFIRSVAFFLKGEYTEALDTLLPIYKTNYLICLINRLDFTCAKYHWDTTILSLKQYRKWLQMELREYATLGSFFEEELSSSDEDGWTAANLKRLNENEVFDEAFQENHPIECMLMYILRSI